MNLETQPTIEALERFDQQAHDIATSDEGIQNKIDQIDHILVTIEMIRSEILDRIEQSGETEDLLEVLRIAQVQRHRVWMAIVLAMHQEKRRMGNPIRP